MSALTYSNPLWDGTCADPAVLRHGDFYCCYGTADVRDASDNRKFIALRSPDLVHWEPLGGVLEPLPGHENADFWAPEVAFANGRFWMYYSSDGHGSTQRLQVAVADHPAGPFRTVNELLLPDEGFSIDASPFHDPQSGKWYLYFARDAFEGRVGTGTAVVELGADMHNVASAPVPVVMASADWQVFQRNRPIYNQVFEAWHTVEGPFVVFHDGHYYCFYSGGNYQNDTYGVSFAVADHPLGPWLDEWSEQGPAVLRTGTNAIGPGHNTAILTPDGQTWVCVYHAWNAEGTRRQLCIDPIEWTPEGPRVTPTRGEAQLKLQG